MFSRQQPQQLGSPVPFISLDSNTGKFVAEADALAVLKKIATPVAVVAVCGRARQGKSFLLNQIVRKLKKQQQQSNAGFAVSPSHRPCTKGLWLWSEPIPLPTGPGGKKCHLVMIDCEGIDAYDQSAQYSTQIFSMAVLLSSLFVFNQMGGIDEAALERLSLVSELSRVIYGKTSQGAGGAGADDFAPAFLWLLRDFHLQMTDEGREMSPREYLEEALQVLPGSDDRALGRNQVRESIKALFPNRDCFALVRPHNDEQQLAKMNELPTTQLRQPFREGLDKLVDLVISKAKPKQCFGVTASGMALAGLTQAFVNAINDGAVPAIASAWQYVMRTECQRAVMAAQGHYKGAFNQEVAVDEGAFAVEHNRALQAARQVFHKEASVATDEEKEPFLKQLQEAAEAHMQSIKKQRFVEAAAGVTALLNTAVGKFSALMHSPNTLQPTKLASLEASLREFLAHFEATAAGPTKYPQMLKFLRDSILPGWKSLTENALAKMHQAEQEAKAKAQACAKLEERAKALDTQLQAATQKLSSTNQELTSSKLEAGRLQSEVSDLRRERERTQSKVSELQGERDRLLADESKMRIECHKLQHQLESQQSACQQLTQQLSKVQQDLLTTQGDRDQLREAKSKASFEVSSLKKDLVSKEAELAKAISDRQQLRQQLTQQQQATAKAEENLRDLQIKTTSTASSTQATLTSLQQQLATLTQKEQELQDELRTARSAQAAAAAELAETCKRESEVSKALISAQGAKKDVSGELETVKGKAEMLKVQLTAKEAEAMQLTTNLASAQAESAQLRTKMSTQQARSEDLAQQLESLRASLSAGNSDQARLKQQLQEQEQELTVQRMALQQAEANTAAAHADLASVRAEMMQLSDSHSQLKALQQRYADAEAQVRSLQADKVAIQGDNATAQAALKQSLAAAEVRVASLQEDIAAMQADNATVHASLQQRLAAAEEQVTSLQADYSTAQAENARLQDALQQVQQEAESARSAAAAAAAAAGHPGQAHTPLFRAATAGAEASPAPIPHISPINGPSGLSKSTDAARAGVTGEQQHAQEQEHGEGAAPSAPPVPEPASGRAKRKRELDDSDERPPQKRVPAADTTSGNNADSSNHAAGQSPYAAPISNPEGMTVQAIKAWLSLNGYEDAIWELNQQKPKKADWVKLIKDKAGPAS